MLASEKKDRQTDRCQSGLFLGIFTHVSEKGVDVQRQQFELVRQHKLEQAAKHKPE